jgi:hypothetical protein
VGLSSTLRPLNTSNAADRVLSSHVHFMCLVSLSWAKLSWPFGP